MKPIVLIHGAYHGGWCWKKTAERLHRHGASVFTPTLTGLGEKSHLLSNAVNLTTHITDIVNLLTFEDLGDVMLVGHSYAGMVISGVAEHAAERIGCLVYLDALVPVNGQCMFDILPYTKSRVTETTSCGHKVKILTTPPPQAFGISDQTDVAWSVSRLTPMPNNCYAEKIDLSANRAADLPKTYLYCKIQAGGELQSVHDRYFGEAVGRNWSRRIVPGPHDAMITHPVELANVILELASG